MTKSPLLFRPFQPIIYQSFNRPVPSRVSFGLCLYICAIPPFFYHPLLSIHPLPPLFTLHPFPGRPCILFLSPLSLVSFQLTHLSSRPSLPIHYHFLAYSTILIYLYNDFLPIRLLFIYFSSTPLIFTPLLPFPLSFLLRSVLSFLSFFVIFLSTL